MPPTDKNPTTDAQPAAENDIRDALAAMLKSAPDAVVQALMQSLATMGDNPAADRLAAMLATPAAKPASPAPSRSGIPTIEDALALEARRDLAGAATRLAAIVAASPADPESTYQLGRILSGRGDMAGARKHLETSIRLRPEHPAAIRELASVCFATRDFESARGHLERLRSLRPTDAWTLRQLGALHLEMGEFEQAVKVLDAYIFERFEDRRAHLDLARASWRLGRADRARAELEILAKSDTLEPEALALAGELELASGDEARAAENFRAALDAGYDDPHTRILLARALLGRDDAPGALRALKGLDGGGPEAVLEARARFLMGDLRGALARVEQADNIGGNLDALAVRADLQEALGDHAGALATCLQMRHLGCPLSGLALRIGRLQASCGELQAAAETLAGHLKQNSADAAALQLAGEVELRRGNAGGGIDYLTRCVEVAPDIAEVYLRLATVWLEHDRPKRALKAAKRALELQSGDAAAAVAVAEASLALGELDSAHEHYRLALDLGTSNPIVHRRLATLCSKRGDPQRVIEHGLQAATLAIDPQLCLELANAYRARTDATQARTWLQKGLELAPRDVPLREGMAELDLADGLLSEAILHARAALDLNGASRPARRVLGISLARSGHPEQAVPHLISALCGHQEDDEVRLELARSYFKLGADTEILALYPDASTFPAEKESLGIMIGRAALSAGDTALARSVLENLRSKNCESVELMEVLGDTLLACRDLAAAETALAFACRRHELAAGVWTRIARVHWRLGRFFEAREELARARKLAPTDESLYLESARLEIEDRRPAEAVPHLDAFIKMMPRDPRGYYHRGEVFLLTSQPQQAEECLRRALHHDPGHLDACLALGRLLLRQGRGTEARRMLESFADRAGKREVVLADLASVYLAENRPREAEAYLRELVSAGPAGLAGLRPLAELLLSQKRDREVLAVLESAGPEAPAAMIELAGVLRKQGERRRARMLFERALALGADRQEALLGIARCHIEAGELSPARQRFEQVVSIAPDNVTASVELASVLLTEAGSDTSPAAARLLDRALELLTRFKPRLMENAEHARLYARIAARRGRWDDAAEAVSHSLSLDDKQADAHALLGEVHLARGERKEALESYLKALALDPGLEDAACQAIAFLEAGGHLVQARDVMERVVEKRPLSKRARLGLARLCYRLKDLRAAALHWEAAARETTLSNEDYACLAGAYLTLGRFADAERINAAQLASAPKSLPSLLLAGDIARAAGRLAEARVRYEQAARIHPQSPACPAKLADLYRFDGRLQDALLQVRRAIDLEPSRGELHLEHGKILLALERHEAARDALERALQKPGSYVSEARLLLGRVHRKLENRRQAVDVLEELVSTTRDATESLQACADLAELHFERGDWPRSAECFERLRASKQGLDPAGRSKLVVCYARMGMSAKAAGVLRELSGKTKPDVETLLETARAHVRQGLQREALALLAEHAASREPAGRARLHLEMARIHHRAGDRRSAEQNLLAAIQARPDDAEAQSEIASYLEETGQHELMRSTFHRITEQYPSDARALCYLGSACLRLGRSAEARAAFARAVKLDYNLFVAHAGLARAARQEGDLVGAVDEYRKAQFLAPKNARLVFELATALAEAGHAGHAAAAFEKVLELEASGALGTAAREHLSRLRMKKSA